MSDEESHLEVDEAAGAAYLYLRGVREIDRTLFVTDEVNVDVDENGDVVGVEILDLDTEIPYAVLARDFGLSTDDLEPLEQLQA